MKEQRFEKVVEWGDWKMKFWEWLFWFDKEVWYYTCENGHEWKSYSSPRGTYIYGESGQTKCPKCGTPVCMGNVYINGKKTQMGSIHCDFGKGRKIK